MAYLNTSVGQSVAPCRMNPASSSSHFPTPSPPFVRCDLINPCFWIVLVSNHRLEVGTGLLFLRACSPNSFSACRGIHTWLASHFNLFPLIGSCVFCRAVVMEPSSQVPKVIFISMTFSISLGHPTITHPSFTLLHKTLLYMLFFLREPLSLVHFYQRLHGCHKGAVIFTSSWPHPRFYCILLTFFSFRSSNLLQKNKQRLDGIPYI